MDNLDNITDMNADNMNTDSMNTDSMNTDSMNTDSMNTDSMNLDKEKYCGGGGKYDDGDLDISGNLKDLSNLEEIEGLIKCPTSMDTGYYFLCRLSNYLLMVILIILINSNIIYLCTKTGQRN